MNTISPQEINDLKSRWLTAEGKLTISNLYRDRVNFSDSEARTKAVITKFTPNDLRGISFVNEVLNDQFLFCDLDLSYSDFSGAILSGSFQESRLVGCRFDSTHFNLGYFESAILAGASFVNAYLSNIEFDSANLALVNFQGANFFDVSFTNTDLTTANLDGVKFGKMKFYKTKICRNSEIYEHIMESKALVFPQQIIVVD